MSFLLIKVSFQLFSCLMYTLPILYLYLYIGKGTIYSIHIGNLIKQSK